MARVLNDLQQRRELAKLLDDSDPDGPATVQLPQGGQRLQDEDQITNAVPMSSPNKHWDAERQRLKEKVLDDYKQGIEPPEIDDGGNGRAPKDKFDELNPGAPKRYPGMSEIDQMMDDGSSNAISKASYIGDPNFQDKDSTQYGKDLNSARRGYHQGLNSIKEFLHPDAEFDASDEDSAAPVPGVDHSSKEFARRTIESSPTNMGRFRENMHLRDKKMFDSLIEDMVRQQRGPERKV